MHLLITQRSAKKRANLEPTAVAKRHHANVLSLFLPCPRFVRICLQQT